MPFIYNNVVTSNDQPTEAVQPSTAVRFADIPRNVPAPPAAPEQVEHAVDHPVLIVNGQAKKVGKKSQYLLDMLTIDSE